MSNIGRKVEIENSSSNFTSPVFRSTGSPPRKNQKTHDHCLDPISDSIQFIQFLLRDSLKKAKGFDQSLCNLSFAQLHSTLRLGYAVSNVGTVRGITEIDNKDKKFVTLARLLLSIIYYDCFLLGSMEFELNSDGLQKGRSGGEKQPTSYNEMIRSHDILKTCNGFARASHQTWKDAFVGVDEDSDFSKLQKTLSIEQMRTFVLNYIIEKNE